MHGPAEWLTPATLYSYVCIHHSVHIRRTTELGIVRITSVQFRNLFDICGFRSPTLRTTDQRIYLKARWKQLILVLAHPKHIDPGWMIPIAGLTLPSGRILSLACGNCDVCNAQYCTILLARMLVTPQSCGVIWSPLPYVTILARAHQQLGDAVPCIGLFISD